MDLGKLGELSERRGCVVCGREYRSDRLGVVGGKSAMQKLVEHLIEHQPGPEQWTEAYERIRARRPVRQKGMSGE